MNEKNASRLAILRHEIGITQRVLAARAGLSLPYIKKLEQGTKPMSKRPAVAIAIATGVDWQWLTGSGKTFPIMAKLGMSPGAIRSSRAQLPNLRGSKLTDGKRRDLTAKEIRGKLAAGVLWKKEMADVIQNRREIKPDETEKMEQKLYWLRHQVFCAQLSHIIQAAIKQKRPDLVCARIEDFIRELAAEPWLNLFNPAKPPRR